MILDGSDSRTADDVSRHEGSKSVVIEDQGNGMMEKIKAERQSSPAPRISGQINSVSTETEGNKLTTKKCLKLWGLASDICLLMFSLDSVKFP